MAGAIGPMTLAVMSRATLRHTGRVLTANCATVVNYLCVFATAFTRFLPLLKPDFSHLPGVLRLMAFVGFAAAYGPLLLKPKHESQR
ncbi:NnrS protein [Falsiruegeria litorea R37]|uniref:NnrS protein n=1 Tax=Falsiruegeria litorea R37 TaxID=1200284 RepID=A0A1Y5T8J6_9RHOB|nr:NnrS protein [Falsiruegeria litorea R37]